MNRLVRDLYIFFILLFSIFLILSIFSYILNYRTKSEILAFYAYIFLIILIIFAIIYTLDTRNHNKKITFFVFSFIIFFIAYILFFSNLSIPVYMNRVPVLIKNKYNNYKFYEISSFLLIFILIFTFYSYLYRRSTLKFIFFFTLFYMVLSLILDAFILLFILYNFDNLLIAIVILRKIILSISLVFIILAPVSSAVYYYKVIKRKLVNNINNIEIFKNKKDFSLLIGALSIAFLSVSIPHLSGLNPQRYTVSVDTLYNARWLNILNDKGLIEGILDLSHLLRPLYLLYIYILYQIIGVSSLSLADIYLPLFGFIILIFIVYIIVKKEGGNAGYASLLSILYWSPVFIYGGFQTNLYALSFALIFAYLVWKEKRKGILLIGSVLGLWHPWTFAYYTIASIPVVIYKRIKFKKSILKIFISLIISWLIVIFINFTLLRSADVFKLLIKETDLKWNPIFTIFIYVWGTAARPEILVPTIICLWATRKDNWAYWFVAPAFLVFPFLSPTLAYRILVEAPVPLVISNIKNKHIRWGITVSAFGSWLFFVTTAAPLAGH